MTLIGSEKIPLALLMLAMMTPLSFRWSEHPLAEGGFLTVALQPDPRPAPR